MFILICFAFLAGIVTILSPCVLPVLPALLSTGTLSGKLRPLGIVAGVVVSFTLFTLLASTLFHYTPLSPSTLRQIAILIIALFALFMIFPRLGDWFSQATQRIAQVGTDIQAKQQTTDGFWAGFLLGCALGLVWTPCAGPILASIITLIAVNAISLKVVILLLAYIIGAAIPMFLIIYGGQRILQTSKFLSRHAVGIRQFFGLLMLLTAFALALNLDVPIQESLLKYFPAYNVEDNKFVRKNLNKLHGKNNISTIQYKEGEVIDKLPKIAAAPEFVGIDQWFNSPPLTMNELRGKVVLIDFWTYSCINCLRTLPYQKKWYEQYKDKGFVIVGVHTPEFAFEKKPENVKKAIEQLQITYPVALDNQFKTWRAYGNMYWPAHYLVDRNGIIRQIHFGEGAYRETENAIRELVGLLPIKEKEPLTLAHPPLTPETYLGYQRAAGYPEDFDLQNGKTTTYTYNKPLKDNQTSLTGKWLVGDEKITAEGDDSTLNLNFEASQVYLVLGGHSDQPITIKLDGKPLESKYYTDDMNDKGEIFIKNPRKYDVVNLRNEYGRHTISLHIPKGIEAYAFTFGFGALPQNPDKGTGPQ